MKLTAAGIETFYQKIGHGYPVVLLHGWGCDWQIWHPIISRFDARFQLLIPDLPAFGQSQTPAQVWNSQAYVSWLNDFIAQTIPDQKYTLLGHSFGGKISALSAATQPKQLEKIILVDISGLPDTLSLTQKLKQQIVSSVPSFIKDALPLSQRQKLLEKIGMATDHTFANASQKAILRQVIGENIADQLPRIQVPTQIIWGEKDLDTPLHQAHQLHTLISHSNLTIIPNVAHFPFIEAPELFMKSVANFLP